MVKYILRRVLWSIPVLLAVSLITFGLMHLVSGGPWDADHGDRPVSAAVKQALATRYGLDKPLYVQYLSYIGGVLHGDFGISYDDSRPVNTIIAQDFPVSAAFGVTALILGLTAGIPFGLLSALRHNGQLDRLGTLLVTISIATPNFVLAITLILVFAVNLHLVTVQFQRDRWQSWILPLCVLTVNVFALVVRFMRAGTLDILDAEYIRTARMKGLHDKGIIFRHILRNALIPIVTLVGPLAADVLTGSFIVESIFGIPGIGRTFVTAIVSRDYSLLMGVTLFFAILLILCNLLVDVSYTVIDPRITYR